MSERRELEKLMFLFPRKDGLTRDEFFQHYLDVHAPLGMELTRAMVHYTVNLRDVGDRAPEGVDAITETWTASAADFMNPEQSFASPADAQRLMDDHNSFIGDPYDVYLVEERVRKGPARAAQRAGRSSDDKVVIAVSDAASGGGRAVLDRFASVAESADVTRYVESRVTSALATGAFGARAAFVEVNLVEGSGVAEEIEKLLGDDGVVYHVKEYVQK
jgi:hypothetical protein